MLLKFPGFLLNSSWILFQIVFQLVFAFPTNSYEILLSFRSYSYPGRLCNFSPNSNAIFSLSKNCKHIIPSKLSNFIGNRRRCIRPFIWLSRTDAITALFFTQTLQSLSVCLFVLCHVPFAIQHDGAPYWTDGTRGSSFFFARSPPLVALINPFEPKMT